MAKSLSSILSQIERLQKEAASIQSEVIDKIKKEIAKYSLTPEQLFGQAKVRSAKTAKPTRTAPKSRTAKYADGSGNTWGGMGKRPGWLRQALEAGKALEEFLVGSAKPKKAAATRAAKPVTKGKRKAAITLSAVTRKRTAAKKPAAKPRAAAAIPAKE